MPLTKMARAVFVGAVELADCGAVAPAGLPGFATGGTPGFAVLAPVSRFFAKSIAASPTRSTASPVFLRAWPTSVVTGGGLITGGIFGGGFGGWITGGFSIKHAFRKK